MCCPEHPCQNIAKVLLRFISSCMSHLSITGSKERKMKIVYLDSNISFRNMESSVRKAGSPGKDLLKISAFRLLHMIHKVCARQALGMLQRMWNANSPGAAVTSIKTIYSGMPANPFQGAIQSTVINNANRR